MDKIVILYNRIKELEIWLDVNENKSELRELWNARYKEVGTLYATIFYQILPDANEIEADFIINKIELPKRLSFRHVIREVAINDFKTVI